MSSGMTLLSVDKVRELGRVSQEEHGRIVRHHVPGALISAELDGKSTWVASAVSRARLSTDGREADGERAGLSRLEDVRHAEILNGIGGLVVTMSATAFRVDNTFGDPLSVEVREKIN